jgi:hypothetical protein
VPGQEVLHNSAALGNVVWLIIIAVLILPRGLKKSLLLEGTIQFPIDDCSCLE